MKYSIIAFVALLLAVPLAAYSGDYEEYFTNESNPGTKLAYGVTETALCWTEIPQAVGYYSEKYDPVSGLFLGVAEGTLLGIKDCAEGTVDATLFLFPPYETQGNKFFQKLKAWDKDIQERLW